MYTVCKGLWTTSGIMGLFRAHRLALRFLQRWSPRLIQQPRLTRMQNRATCSLTMPLARTPHHHVYVYTYPPAIPSSCKHSCVHRSYPYRQLSCGVCMLSESSVQKTVNRLESLSPGEKLADGRTACMEHGGDVGNNMDFDKVENLICPGCGAKFQSSDPEIRGFLPPAKLAKLHQLISDSVDQNDTTESSSTSTTANPIICQRCFSLKQYNTALNISLSSDDYLRYLGHLRDKDALILLMLDVSDFPGSIFPDLHTLISPSSQIVIVANKVDLIPRDVSNNFWKQFQKMLVRECKRLSLGDRDIARVHFVSAKTGLGVSELADDIIASWGSRGDVYLLGCTNAGKSTLFNRLLVYMCGVRPGELNRDDKMSTFVPRATISQWPGTTLGLLSFPIMSVGKRRRLMAQAEARKMQLALNPPEALEDDFFEKVAFGEEDDDDGSRGKITKKSNLDLLDTEAEDILRSIGLYRNRQRSGEDTEHDEMPPMNRHWLHDTPGAINDAQLINLLTSKELRLALPKKPLKPRTFILKPGQCLFLGGLARLDYEEGPVSAYFTVFAGSYLPVHVAKIERADGVYERNIGSYLLKIPIADGDRLDRFPPLEPQDLTIHGKGWKACTADVILSSAGWVGVTIGEGKAMQLKAYTPLGKGVFVREPPLFPLAVNERGKRSRKGNRSAFKGKPKKKRREFV